MGINIKYYVISIASIFISLGIGIFIGFNMNGQDLYLEQQQALINSLENRFNEFKKENQDLQEKIDSINVENDKKNIFIESTFNEIVTNKLSGLNVAIIETADDYFYDDIYNTLNLSGANVPIRIQYSDKVFTATNDKLEEINQLLQVQLNTTEDLVQLVNNEVTNFLLNKEITEAFNFIIDEEYINYEINYSSTEELSIENVIIAGGGNNKLENKVEQIDVNLISRLNNLGFKVIGVERLDVDQSFIQDIKRLNVTTIDNINNKIGQSSLVFALLGAQGHFGEKPTADLLIPNISTDQVRGEEVE